RRAPSGAEGGTRGPQQSQGRLSAMRIAAAALALASFVTVPQHDAQRSNLDAPYVSVSGDGRYVALVSQARLGQADTDELRDVYVLDRAAGSVSLESVQLQGSPP